MSPISRLHPSIIREYDIRGIVGETLSTDDARAIGRAFATMARDRIGPNPTLYAGYDGRLTSPDLLAALADGMVEVGATVRVVGRGPTPMLYFAVHHAGADGGVMVTGSHNPPSHNGFKFMLGGTTLHGSDIRELNDRSAVPAERVSAGNRSAIDVFDAYVDRLVAAFQGNGRLKVAWDPGNGAAGEVTKRLTERLPGTHALINDAIDGRFPSHHPDPTVPKNLEQLVALVRRSGSDLGVAFDGDGDRIGVVDSGGRIIYADLLLALLARDVLRERPGATVIADVKSSNVLFEEIARLGGHPLMWRTGHSLIKSKMAETKAPLAGEMSGHVFFADHYYGYDDALYAAIRLLNVLEREGKSLSDLRDELPAPENTPEIRFDCPDDRKFTVVEQIRDRLRAEGADVVDLDGVRVTTEDGWWLVRASNTQAVLVARCEGRDIAALERVKAALARSLATAGLSLPEV
jgi:phosphomannomutase